MNRQSWRLSQKCTRNRQMFVAFFAHFYQAIESGASIENLMGSTSEIMMAYSMLVYRIVSAQIEADELNEAWS